MAEMHDRFYDRLMNSVQGRMDGAKGVPVADGDGAWTTPHLHGYLGGRLRAKLDLELVRLAGELRAIDPVIARQQLVVRQRQRELGETADPTAPAPPAGSDDKRALVDYLRTRRRYQAEVVRVASRRDEFRRHRDEAERDLAQLHADRARLVDETVGRLHRHVAEIQSLSGVYARRMLRSHDARAALSRRSFSVDVDLTEYVERIAALAEPPHATTEGI